MATTPTPEPDPFAGLSGIFDKIIGSNTKTKDDTDLQIQNLLDQLTKSSGSTNQATTGDTTNQSSTAQLQQLLSAITGNVNTTTNSTQSTSADLSNLQKVFAQQQAGITPDALKAIFSEGAKQVPQLVSTYANALGARADTNGPLSSALRDLDTNLTNSAATQNQALLNASGTTAQQIADLSKSIATTGNTGQTSTQTTNTNNQVGTNVAGGTTQNTNVAGTSQNTTDANTVQNQTQNKQDNSQQTVGINTAQVGTAAGIAGLASLLGGSGASNLLGGITNLFTGGSSTTPGGTTPNLDPNSPGFVGPPNPDPNDPGTNPFNNPGINPGDTGTATPAPAPAPAPPPDNPPPPDDGGFADGGLIPMRGKRNYADGGTVANPAGVLQPQAGGLSVNTPAVKPPSITDILNQSNIQGGAGSVNLTGVLGAISGGNPVVGAGLLTGIDQSAGAPGGPGPGSTGSGTGTTGNSGVSAPDANNGFSVSNNDGQSGLSVGQAISAIGAIATANPIGIAQSVASIAHSIANATPATQTITAHPDQTIAPIADETFDTIGPVSMSSEDQGESSDAGNGNSSGTGVSADNGASSDSGNGNGSSGDSGDSGGGDGGFADGGLVSDQRIEPKVGTKSPVRTSGAGPMSVPAIVAAQASASNPASAAAQSKLRANFLANPKAIIDGQITDAEGEAPPKTSYADGGNVTPAGVKDNFSINVSGGEYMMPKDVVDVLGAPFFDAIRNAYHTPAVIQKAQAGVGNNTPNSVTPSQNIR